jgi:hypothetical protein
VLHVLYSLFLQVLCHCAQTSCFFCVMCHFFINDGCLYAKVMVLFNFTSPDLIQHSQGQAL